MAGTLVMVASIIVVLTVWDTVSRLRSIETREMIEKFLAQPPGDGMGLTVESVIEILRVTSMVTAVCAVAAVALGWRVLQRSTRARAGLSVLAVPLFVTGLVAGGFAASVVGAATVMLWLPPSREWFAGIKPTERPTAQGSAGTPAPAPPVSDAPASWPYPSPPEVATRRPDTVTVAMVVTIVAAGLIFLMSLVSLVVLATQPDLVMEEVRRQNPDLAEQGISETMLRTTSYVTGGIVLVWSASVMVLAMLMAGRRRWAAHAVFVSAAVCAVLCIVATLASPVALFPAMAAIATLSCLRRADARAWFGQN